MNWKRILAFLIILVSVSGFARFPFALIRGYCISVGARAPMWVERGTLVAVPAASVAVIALLAYVQRSKPFLHCFVVGAVPWLLFITLTAGAFGKPWADWARSGLVPATVILAGAGIGMGARALGSWRKGRESRI